MIERLHEGPQPVFRVAGAVLAVAVRLVDRLVLDAGAVRSTVAAYLEHKTAAMQSIVDQLDRAGLGARAIQMA